MEKEKPYTVVDPQGFVIRGHLSAREAAQTVMQYDGHDYEIRPAKDGIGFELWTTQFSRNSTLGGRPMVKSVIYSLCEDQDAAEAEIFEKVLANAEWWKGVDVKEDSAWARAIISLYREIDSDETINRIAEKWNCREVEISDDCGVWIRNTGSGQWLCPDYLYETAEFLAVLGNRTRSIRQPTKLTA